MGGDVSDSWDEGDKGAVVTLVERHELMTAPVGGERDTEMRSDIPKSRKHATSKDTAVE